MADSSFMPHMGIGGDILVTVNIKGGIVTVKEIANNLYCLTQLVFTYVAIDQNGKSSKIERKIRRPSQ
jgi:hypothetical protein